MPFGGENAESYYDEGLTSLVKGDLERAINHFTKAIQLDSMLLGAYQQLGKCYLRMGQAQRAVDILGQVVSRKPELVPARLDLAYALLQLGKTEMARQQFQQILTIQPANAKAHLGMGHAAFNEGQWDAAMTLAQAARAYGGSSFAVLFLLGRAAKLAGKNLLADETLSEAENLIEKSVELSPDMPEGYFLRGEVCFVRERWAIALDCYRAAEERAEWKRSYSAYGENFTRIDILAKHGLCLQRQGNISGARTVGEQIIAIEPEHRIGQMLAKLS